MARCGHTLLEREVTGTCPCCAEAKIERLRALLKEARQYVADAGSYEEPGEHQAALLSDIDTALS